MAPCAFSCHGICKKSKYTVARQAVPPQEALLPPIKLPLIEISVEVMSVTLITAYLRPFVGTNAAITLMKLQSTGMRRISC
jgi:hypothetical protein